MPVTQRTIVISVRTIMLLTAIMFSATPLSAQAVPAVASKASMVSELVPGMAVRVALGSGAVIEGRFSRLRNDSLALHIDDPRDAVFIPLAEIDTLWLRERSHSAGLLGGALMGGALAGAGIGLMAAGLERGTGDSCNCSAAIVSAVGVGAFVGGMIGGAMGTSTWQARWPR